MNKLITVSCLICFMTISGYAAAQPISQKSEDSATQQLIKEQSSKPLSALDWYNRGVALNNNSDQELACYQKAVEIDPAFAPAYYNMGVIYMKRDMDTEAVNSFNKFLQYSKDEEKKAQVRKAISELSGTSSSSSSQTVSPELKQKAMELYNQGVALNDNSDNEMQYYLQAITLYPGFAAAHMNLGLLYYHRKNYKAALSELTGYIEYTNDPPEKRKQVLNLIEWLKTAAKSEPQQAQPAQQQQPLQPTPQPAPPPAQNNTNDGTQQIQEVPLR